MCVCDSKPQIHYLPWRLTRVSWLPVFDLQGHIPQELSGWASAVLSEHNRPERFTKWRTLLFLSPLHATHQDFPSNAEPIRNEQDTTPLYIKFKTASQQALVLPFLGVQVLGSKATTNSLGYSENRAACSFWCDRSFKCCYIRSSTRETISASYVKELKLKTDFGIELEKHCQTVSNYLRWTKKQWVRLKDLQELLCVPFITSDG